MIFGGRDRSKSPLAGFTLLEVLLAVLLCAVPVVTAQRLLFRAADSVRLASQQALAVRAATNTLERIYAFHVVGLWPQGTVPTGQWQHALSKTIASDHSPKSPVSCINRWCTVDQWAAHEVAAFGCALNADWAAEFCATITPFPMGTQGRLELPQIPVFRASLVANMSLGVRIRWPKAQALHQPTEAGDWCQVTLGDHP